MFLEDRFLTENAQNEPIRFLLADSKTSDSNVNS